MEKGTSTDLKLGYGYTLQSVFFIHIVRTQKITIPGTGIPVTGLSFSTGIDIRTLLTFLAG